MASLDRAIAELSRQQGGARRGGDSLELGNHPGMNLQPKSGPAVGTIGTIGGKAAQGQGGPVAQPMPPVFKPINSIPVGGFPRPPVQGPVFTPIHQIPVGGFPPVSNNPDGGSGPVGKHPAHPDHPDTPAPACGGFSDGPQRSIAVGTSGN